MMYIYEGYTEPRSYELTPCLCSLRFLSSCWTLLAEPLSEDQEPGLNNQVAMTQNSPVWSFNIHTHPSEQDKQCTTVCIQLPLCVFYCVCFHSVCAIPHTTHTEHTDFLIWEVEGLVKFQTDFLCNNRKITETSTNQFLYSQNGGLKKSQ